jgi:hypothetical protein
MSTYRTFLVVLSLVTISTAQQASDAQFKVEGVVVNSLTGEPIPRALVEIDVRQVLTKSKGDLSFEEKRSVLSGAEGEFSFENVPGGHAYITPSKPGYSITRSQSLGFDVGLDAGKIVFRLVPAAVIFGEVTGQDGEPLEGVTVQVLGPGSGSFFNRGEAHTDEDGKFRIQISPGRYRLAVKAGSVIRSVLGAVPKMSYPALLYYPGTPDAAAAASLDLTAGQKAELQFPLSLVPTYKLAGRLVSPPGEPMRWVAPKVIDATDQELFTPDSFDAHSGDFEFRSLPASTYILHFGGANQQDRGRFTTRKVLLSNDLTDFRLAMLPAVTIPVRVRKESQHPLGRCWWYPLTETLNSTDCSDYKAARVELVPLDSLGIARTDGAGVVKDPTSFTIDGVEPGRYSVQVKVPFFPKSYVQSVRSGNLDLLHEPLIVPEDGSVMPIEILLHDDFAFLKVHANGAVGLPNIVVLREGLLLSASQPPDHVDGADFSYALAPGSYAVFAVDSTSVYGDSEALAKYSEKALKVTVSANETTSVSVDVIHTEK